MNVRGPALSTGDVSSTAVEAGVRSRSSPEIATADLRRHAQALLDDGFRLTLVAAHREEHTQSHRVVYLFAAPRPDRRIELVVRTDPGTNTVPSLALLTFPAGRFERELYETHDILASSATPYRTAETGRGPITSSRAFSPRQRWEAQSEGRRLRHLVPWVERAIPDSGVAHALSLCLAIEDAYDRPVPTPGAAARAVLIELERMLSHLDSIAVMCAGAGNPQRAAEAIALRRRILQLNDEISGHRLLRGAIVPGGVRLHRLPSVGHLDELEAAAASLADSVVASPALRQTYLGHWVLTHHHVAMTGALGCVARASGVDIDARRDHPFHPATARVASVVSNRGDALARLEVRARELGAALRLLRDLLPHARVTTAPAGFPFDDAGESRCGIGLVEGPQGTIAHRLDVSSDGRVANLKVVDPSFLTRSVVTLSQRGPHDEHGSMVESGFDLPPRELVR